jgi:hypothetical protein
MFLLFDFWTWAMVWAVINLPMATWAYRDEGSWRQVAWRLDPNHHRVRLLGTCAVLPEAADDSFR